MASNSKKEFGEIRLGGLLISVGGTAAGLLSIFVIIAIMLVFTPSPGNLPVDPERRPPEEIIRAVRAADAQKTTTYGWVDRNQGVVRLPVDAAMEIFLAEQRAGASWYLPGVPAPSQAVEAAHETAPGEAISDAAVSPSPEEATQGAPETYPAE
jgi:hypothetical protein